MCRPGNRIKIEEELFIRENVNFSQQRSNEGLFTGLSHCPAVSIAKPGTVHRTQMRASTAQAVENENEFCYNNL